MFLEPNPPGPAGGEATDGEPVLAFLVGMPTVSRQIQPGGDYQSFLSPLVVRSGGVGGAVDPSRSVTQDVGDGLRLFVHVGLFARHECRNV